MESFKITSSTTNKQYEFKNDSVIVNGGFVKDGTTEALQSINGSLYRINANGEQGDYIGNFNGYQRDDEIRYSMSDMSRRDANLAWDAIDAIETNVLADGASE